MTNIDKRSRRTSAVNRMQDSFPNWLHSSISIKDTKESNSSVSYLDCYLCIDNGKLVTWLYERGTTSISHS